MTIASERECVVLEHTDDCAFVRIRNPPHNVLAAHVRLGILSALLRAGQNPTTRAVVLYGEGRTFSTGADLDEFNGPERKPGYREVFRALERFHLPVIAAVHGLAAGAGAELILACHYRCASPTAAVAFPEILLGLIPGAGGTQRLARLIGARRALEMILRGRPLAAPRCLEAGLIDRIIGDAQQRSVMAYVQELLTAGAAPRPTSLMRVSTAGFDRRTIDDAVNAVCPPGADLTLRHLVVAAINAACSLPFEEGLDLEQNLARQALAARRSMLTAIRAPQVSAQPAG